MVSTRIPQIFRFPTSTSFGHFRRIPLILRSGTRATAIPTGRATPCSFARGSLGWMTAEKVRWRPGEKRSFCRAGLSVFLCCSKYDALGMKQVLPFPHQEGIGRIDFLQPKDLPVANGFRKNQRSWNSRMVIAYSPLSFFSTFPFSSRFTSTTALNFSLHVFNFCNQMNIIPLLQRMK